MDPALALPVGQRLGGIDAEVIEGGGLSSRRELRAREPVRRKLLFAIRHVLAAEDAQFEHLFGRELGLKPKREIAAHGLDELGSSSSVASCRER